MLLTNPLSWTSPLNVSTLISADFKVGSLKIADLAFTVKTLSSTYWPVLSWVLVAEQATNEIKIVLNAKVKIY